MKAIVVTARGLRPVYLGCYGNSWISTPALDRLATESVVFDEHVADVPEPLAAARAWRGGCYQIPDPEGTVPLAPVDLLALLAAHDVPRYLIVEGSCVPDEAWQAGWTRATEVRATDEGTGLDGCLSALADLLDELTDVPDWLVWLDLGTLLPPWDLPVEYVEPYFNAPPAEDEEAEEDQDEEEEEDEIYCDPEAEPEAEPLEPWLDPEPGFLDRDDDEAHERLMHTYAAAVSYLDAGLGLLLDDLRQRGWWDDCLFLVTADAGLALGEHGVIGPHRAWLHGEVSHLPLLLHLPGEEQHAGTRVPALTQSVDLMPTLLEAFGIPIPDPVQGRNLLSLAREETEKVREYACSGWAVAGGLEWALRTPDWALIHPLRGAEGEPLRGAQLYARPEDRWEVNDVQQHYQELVEAMQKLLAEFVAATRRPGPFQPPPPPDLDAPGPEESQAPTT